MRAPLSRFCTGVVGAGDLRFWKASEAPLRAAAAAAASEEPVGWEATGFIAARISEKTFGDWAFSSVCGDVVQEERVRDREPRVLDGRIWGISGFEGSSDVQDPWASGQGGRRSMNLLSAMSNFTIVVFASKGERLGRRMARRTQPVGLMARWKDEAHSRHPVTNLVSFTVASAVPH